MSSNKVEAMQATSKAIASIEELVSQVAAEGESAENEESLFKEILDIPEGDFSDMENDQASDLIEKIPDGDNSINELHKQSEGSRQKNSLKTTDELCEATKVSGENHGDQTGESTTKSPRLHTKNDNGDRNENQTVPTSEIGIGNMAFEEHLQELLRVGMVGDSDPIRIKTEPEDAGGSAETAVHSAEASTPSKNPTLPVLVEDKKWKGVLSKGIAQLWEDQLFCDVQIVTSDGSKINAHSCVLCACSTTFLSLMKEAYEDVKLILDKTGAPLKRIDLPGVSLETMYLVLRFIYFGQVLVQRSNIEQLKNAARYLQLESLVVSLKKCKLARPQNAERKLVKIQFGDKAFVGFPMDTQSQGGKSKNKKAVHKKTSKQKASIGTVTSISVDPRPVTIIQPDMSRLITIKPEPKEEQVSFKQDVVDDEDPDTDDDVDDVDDDDSLSEAEPEEPTTTSTRSRVVKKPTRFVPDTSPKKRKRSCEGVIPVTKKKISATFKIPKSPKTGKEVKVKEEKVEEEDEEYSPSSDEDSESEEEAGQNDKDDEDYEPEPWRVKLNRRNSKAGHEEDEEDEGKKGQPQRPELPDVEVSPIDFCIYCGGFYETRPDTDITELHECDAVRTGVKRVVRGVWSCPLCDLQIPTHGSNRCKAHLNGKHHQLNLYKCTLCGVGVKLYKSMQLHIENYCKARPNAVKEVSTCTKCGKQFKKRRYVQAHEKYCGVAEKPRCEICNTEFACNISYKSHMQKVHPKGDKVQEFVCPTCGKKFANNSNLDIHYRIHTGEKPFKCEQCGEAFRVKCTLQSHMKSAHNIHKEVTLKHRTKFVRRRIDK